MNNLLDSTEVEEYPVYSLKGEIMDENETLIDVEVRDGVLVKKVARKDGRIDYVPVEHTNTKPSMTERFADTETIPADWKPTTTEVLMPKQPLTREEHVDRSCRVEAVLIKAFSPRMRGDFTESLNTNGNTAVKELLEDLCRAMGGPWLEEMKRIK